MCERRWSIRGGEDNVVSEFALFGIELCEMTYALGDYRVALPCGCRHACHARFGRCHLIRVRERANVRRQHRKLFLVGKFGWARMGPASGSHGAANFGGIPFRSHRPWWPTPAIRNTRLTEPSTFVVVGEQDGIAPPAVMERRVAALRKAGTDVEFYRYSGLGHGLGLAPGQLRQDGWTGRFDSGRGLSRRVMTLGIASRKVRRTWRQWVKRAGRKVRKVRARPCVQRGGALGDCAGPVLYLILRF